MSFNNTIIYHKITISDKKRWNIVLHIKRSTLNISTYLYSSRNISRSKYYIREKKIVMFVVTTVFYFLKK